MVCCMSVRCPFTFSNIFSETAWPIKAKFYVEPPWIGKRMTVCGILVTWPRWPPCPYMVKTLQKSSSREPVDRSPWNLVCCIGVLDPDHHSLFKWWPLVDFDLFDSKVKFCIKGFSIEKNENIEFFRNSLEIFEFFWTDLYVYWVVLYIAYDFCPNRLVLFVAGATWRLDFRKILKNLLRNHKGLPGMKL